MRGTRRIVDATATIILSVSAQGLTAPWRTETVCALAQSESNRFDPQEHIEIGSLAWEPRSSQREFLALPR